MEGGEVSTYSLLAIGGGGKVLSVFLLCAAGREYNVQSSAGFSS